MYCDIVAKRGPTHNQAFNSGGVNKIKGLLLVERMNMKTIMALVQGSDIAPAVAVITTLLVVLFIFIVLIVGLILWCKIFSKTGYSWAFGLLMFVPIANVVMLFVLAFGDWPILRELRLLKQMQPPAKS